MDAAISAINAETMTGQYTRRSTVAGISDPRVYSATVQHIRAQIDRHWGCMPAQAKSFVLEKLGPDFSDFQQLARFWSSPSMIECTRGGAKGIVGMLCGASWFIALNYLKLGQHREASLLTLNGAFLHQCSISPIEKILEAVGPNFDQWVDYVDFPAFASGFASLGSRVSMDAYIRGPLKYQHMANFPEKAMEFVSQIGEDWSDSHSSARGRRQGPSSKCKPKDEGNLIQISIVDGLGSNEDEQHSFDIESRTALKTLFNDYAERRGVSLRSLRFSHRSKSLFLSSIGKKSPKELNIRERDVITVYDTSASTGACEESRSTSKKAETTRRLPRRSKGKKKKKRQSQEKLVVTLEEYKAQHSKLLSKLHEEVEHRLKEIRTRLNTLCLERSPPKQRIRSKKTTKANTNLSMPMPNSGIGGKAGKTHFLVLVGEVQNLYKTAKPSSQQRSHSALTLDLHGLTRRDALTKLDESLEVWVETAMRGSYPFVVPAKIVCGCGNQIISETVEKWIGSTRNVGNAPNQPH